MFDLFHLIFDDWEGLNKSLQRLMYDGFASSNITWSECMLCICQGYVLCATCLFINELVQVQSVTTHVNAFLCNFVQVSIIWVNLTFIRLVRQVLFVYFLVNLLTEVETFHFMLLLDSITLNLSFVQPNKFLELWCGHVFTFSPCFLWYHIFII